MSGPPGASGPPGTAGTQGVSGPPGSGPPGFVRNALEIPLFHKTKLLQSSRPPPTPEYLAESVVQGFQAASLAPLIIATIFVFARFYTRRIILRVWGWEDSLLLLAWVWLPPNIILCKRAEI